MQKLKLVMKITQCIWNINTQRATMIVVGHGDNELGSFCWNH